MQDVAELIDEKLLDHFPIRRFGTFGMDGRAVGHGLPGLVECRSLHELPLVAFIPGTARVDLAMVALSGRIVEELIDQTGGGSNFPDGEARLAHALQRRGERLHVGDFARHQELQRILGADIVAEIDQSLVDDLRAGLGRDVAAQIDVELPGDLEIIRRPRISLRVEQVNAAAARDRNERVRFGRLALELHRGEMHARQRADDLEMAEFLRPDVHQEVFSLRRLRN